MALDAFLLDLTLEGRSSGTVRTYRSLLKDLDVIVSESKETGGLTGGVSEDAEAGRRCDLLALTPEVCRRLIADRLTRQARSTARTFSGALASFCAYITIYGIPDPMKDVPTPRPVERPHTYLSKDELQALWHACPDPSYELMFLLLCCGLRASELCSLGAVSGDTAQIRGKGGKHRQIALPVAAIALLERIGAPAYSTERLRMRVRRLAKLAGVKRRVHPHMFRHSFASHALMEGMDTETLRMLGGWSDGSKMLAHYTRSVREEAALKRSRDFDLMGRLLGE
ncbi:MAG: tyrosine-type recombinase/integrase [Acidobacteriota bacterium]|nr:tyrosine-type recombinase/integrase [Acidobacteriota bacterium]